MKKRTFESHIDKVLIYMTRFVLRSSKIKLHVIQFCSSYFSIISFSWRIKTIIYNIDLNIYVPYVIFAKTVGKQFPKWKSRSSVI